MSQKIKNILLQSLPVTLLATLFVAAVIYAWTEPKKAPPQGNVEAPLNVSDRPQVKEGGLSVGAFTSNFGTILAKDIGNVGIGTTIPGAKLDVVGDVKILGDWKTLSKDIVYQAPTDGFVVAFISETQYNCWIKILTDSNNPPTTVRIHQKVIRDWNGTDSGNAAAFSPVKKGDFWKVEAGTSATVSWIPFGRFAKSQTFTASGAWIKPAGVNEVNVTICGAGGGGGGGGDGDKCTNSKLNYAGGAGGGGGECIKKSYDVTNITNISVKVGAGGIGGTGGVGDDGVKGESSSFGTIIANGGNGGTGGGHTSTGYYPAGGIGYSGANGGNGGNASYGSGGGSHSIGGGNGGGGGSNGNDGYAGGGGGGGGGYIDYGGNNINGGKGGGYYHGDPGYGGNGYGSGGGGGGGDITFNPICSYGSSLNGGNGAPGIVIVEWEE